MNKIAPYSFGNGYKQGGGEWQCSRGRSHVCTYVLTSSCTYDAMYIRTHVHTLTGKGSNKPLKLFLILTQFHQEKATQSKVEGSVTEIKADIQKWKVLRLLVKRNCIAVIREFSRSVGVSVNREKMEGDLQCDFQG